MTSIFDIPTDALGRLMERLEDPLMGAIRKSLGCETEHTDHKIRISQKNQGFIEWQIDDANRLFSFGYGVGINSARTLMVRNRHDFQLVWLDNDVDLVVSYRPNSSAMIIFDGPQIMSFNGCKIASMFALLSSIMHDYRIRRDIRILQDKKLLGTIREFK